MDTNAEKPVDESAAVGHDRLFKELLRVFFMELLELFFPQVAEFVDPGSLEFLDKEVFTDVTHGERHEADLVVKATFRGQATEFLIHAEAQAKQQKHFPSRMFTYFARFHELHRLPIYPIAIFSYVSPRKPEPAHYTVGFPDLQVLKFRFRTIQLNRLDWRHFLRNTNPIACALMARMRIRKKDRARVKAECLRLLVTLHLDPARQQLITGFVDSYLRLNGPELIEFKREIANLGPEEEKTVLKITTSWKEEGIAEGKLEGKLEGLLAGLRPALRLRFGEDGLAFLSDLRKGVSLARLEQIAAEVDTRDLAALRKIAFK